MSTTEIRNAATDNYIVLSQYDASNNLEVAIAQALVQSAYDKITIDTSTGIYVSPANDSSWNCLDINNGLDISNNLVNNSAISNYPNGTVTEYSVISSRIITEDVSTNLYTTNISSVACNNNTYNFESLPTSAAYYDANYVFTQNLIADCSDNVTGSYVTGTLDVNASNSKIQYAMQSRWNTVLGPYVDLSTVGPDPVAITQDVNFNTNFAFAEYGTGATDASYESYWFSPASNGGLNVNLIDASYQPINNNLLVQDRDMSGVVLNVNNDVGIFRIQQASNLVLTTVTLDGSSNPINNDDLNYMPLFDGNGQDPLTYDSSKNSLPIPGQMSASEFESLLNTDVYNTVANGWTYIIDVSSNNGGYSINTDHPLVSDLNNDNLLDNPYYMENYVSNDHSINFSNSTITIDPSTNGVSADALTIDIDLTQGERLDATYAGVDGQIILNTNTVETRYGNLVSQDLSGNFVPQVFYAEDASNGVQSLSSEEMTNPILVGMWQKVAQESSVTDPDYWLKQSNDAILTLYADPAGIVNSSFNASDFDFSFNQSPFSGSENIQLWNLSVVNNIIVNPQSFYASADYNPNSLEEGIATTGIITSLLETINYDSYRILLIAKTKEDISLYNAVTAPSVNGWELNYSDPAHTFLHTDSAQATSTNALPIYNSGIVAAINNDASLNYTYTYKTREDAFSPAGLVDYVDISYSILDTSYNVTIYQPQITRIYDNEAADVSYNVVPDTSYNFGGIFYNKTNWELVYVTAKSKYNASFFANYGPFTNLTLSVNDILQTDNYYAIRNKSNGHFAPQTALIHVTYPPDVPPITDLGKVFEIIEPSPGNTLTISGVFTSNDLKPFMSIVQGEATPTNWTNIGTAIETDVYYGLANIDNTIEGSGNLITNIQYTPFSDSVNSSVNVVLDQLNYYIPFVYSQSENSFTLESFSCSPSTIAANTNIGSLSFVGNTNYLTLTNGYSSVTTWNTNDYVLDISRNSLDTIFTVTDLSDNIIFQITTLNNTIFLGEFIVSYIPNDYYRIERSIGVDFLDLSYNEIFTATDYDNGMVNLGPLLQGIYIGDMPNSLSPTFCPNLGSYQYFKVIGDYMSINQVGNASSPTPAQELGIDYNGGSLSFQYPNSPNNYSAIFTFPKYRGYFSYTNTNPDEYYTINRDSTIVTFDVSGSPSISDTLTSNMYFNESFTVDNLQNLSNELVANLGVTGSFNYSIPPTGYNLSYSVTVTGDSVNVSFTNPNYLGDASNVIVDPSATPVVDPRLYSDSMTLKNYGQNDMYTFSGAWYATGRLMAIRPSRVKLNNSAYPYTTFQYQLQLQNASVYIYKAKYGASTFNWLGNPAIKGSQDPENPPSSADWQVVGVYDASYINVGFDIGKKHIVQDPGLAVTLKIVYIVSAPPYYKFEQISTETTDGCPVIPYDYDSQYGGNRKTMYKSYITTTDSALVSVFNPFQPSTTYTDINGNDTTVTNDPEYINNITFTLSSTPSITDAAEDPDSTRYGIIVPGTNLTVDLYDGLYNDTNPGSHTNPIWTGPVTSIPSTPNIGSNALIFRNRDASGAITFSALQYPADIGYSSGTLGYEEIFLTDNSSNWYNIDFKMGNSSWFNDNTPVTYFDVEAHGIKPTLYTVVDVNNPLTQINKRRVYKYTTDSSIDIDASSVLQTFNITFNNRSYHDFDISKNNVFPSTSTSIWQYNDLLHNTVIPNSNISWTTDASYTNIAYVSWAFGNSTTSRDMLIKLFKVQDTQQKWVYIQLEPFMRYLNQFNMQVGSVAWDGSIVAPLVSTRVVELAPLLTDPILQNNTYTTQQYSESTL